MGRPQFARGVENPSDEAERSGVVDFKSFSTVGIAADGILNESVYVNDSEYPRYIQELYLVGSKNEDWNIQWTIFDSDTNIVAEIPLAGASHPHQPDPAPIIKPGWEIKVGGTNRHSSSQDVQYGVELRGDGSTEDGDSVGYNL
jgi:hypothetical protein